MLGLEPLGKNSGVREDQLHLELSLVALGRSYKVVSVRLPTVLQLKAFVRGIAVNQGWLPLVPG